jgi:hypothetical protein
MEHFSGGGTRGLERTCLERDYDKAYQQLLKAIAGTFLLFACVMAFRLSFPEI